MVKVPAIVLAAGASTRCSGTPKLQRIYRGKPLLLWALENLALGELISSLIVVTGFQSGEVAILCEGIPDCRVVQNQRWAEGLSTSLRVGLEALPKDCPGALVALGDTPFFQESTLRAVVPNESELQDFRYPVYNGQAGHPKYFPRWSFAEMANLSGDVGAKLVMKAHPDQCHELVVDDPGILRDFDLATDFEVDDSN